MNRLLYGFTAVCTLILLTLQSLTAADPLALALTADDIDADACRVWHNQESRVANTEKLLRAMGLKRVTNKTEHWHRPWMGGRAGTKPSRYGSHSTTPDAFHYLLAFNKLVAVGSVMTSTREIRYLKAEAPYPGDPYEPDHWVVVDVPPMQTGVRVAAFPVDAETRAILLTDRLRGGRSYAQPVRIFKNRLHNLASTAAVAAKTEYHAPRAFGSRSYAASNVVRGRGPWHSRGKNDDGRIFGPFISDVQPTWYALAWDESQPIAGVFSIDNFSKLRFERFNGPKQMDPLIGTDREWKDVPPEQIHRQKIYVRSDFGRWVAFAEPLQTRGLRLVVEKAWTRETPDSQVAVLESLLVLTDLQDKPVPEVNADGRPEPPIAIPYELPEDGHFTLAINDADGRRVRNLVARVTRDGGANVEGWDGKDDHGQFVSPGAYHWKAITHPGIELRYQQTPYPNVSVHHPENSPWLNSRTGSGGWLADHSPPMGGASGGDYNFFCAPTPESGVGFAACDLSGKKLWGIPNFGAWTGGNRLATDGKKVYVEAFGWHESDAGADRVWEVDIETQKVREVFRSKSNERRVRGCKGIATHDGKVFLAINAREKWITNAAGLDAVDIEKCIPFYKEKRKPRRPYEVVPDPRNDFLRLFRLTGRPPGYARGHGLTFLKSTEGPGRRQEIILAFNKPVNIGSCIFPVPQSKEISVQLFALKPDAPYPPKPRQRDNWLAFETNGELVWDVATPPANTVTRAVMINFVKGATDELTEILAADDGGGGGGGALDLLGDNDAGVSIGGNRKAWQGRLEGMQILRRRYKNLFGSAKVHVSSGAPAKDGTWEAERDDPLSPNDPAIYMMTWDDDQTIRGLAIKEIDCKRAEVDVWTGAGKPQLNGDANWKAVGAYVPRRRMQHSGFEGHNADARYMNGAVDFGEDIRTRAIRLRMVSQWTVNTREGSCAKGGLGLDPARCRVFGIAPLQYLGGEAKVDPLMTERIEMLDPENGKVEKEIEIGKPSDLDFAPDGRLYAVADGKVLRVSLDGGEHQTVVGDLPQPQTIGIDNDGLLYVFDRAPERRQIFVYDVNGDGHGKLVRIIGKPGGYQVGPWDPRRFQDVSSLSVDRENKLWVVDHSYWPKRVACFKTDGTHLRDYFGPTQYGSAGVLDPGNRNRLFYGPMEFELDWEKNVSRLKNLTIDPKYGRIAGEVPIRINDRTYMVNRPTGSHNTMKCGFIYIYENDRIRPVAAVGHADAFPPLQRQDIIDRLDGKLLIHLQFIWTDRNGDQEVQFEELVIEDRKRHGGYTRFDHRMELQAGKYRYRIKTFLPNGAPVYEEVELNLNRNGQAYRLDNGNFYARGDGDPDIVYTPKGKVVWTYPNEGAGVGPDRSCSPYTPDQVVCQFAMVGHETARNGDLGEFFVYNANLGSWNIWTVDGLLAGRIFQDQRDPKRIPWTMQEHHTGLDVSDVTVGQEHFNGWFCRMTDGKYYLVAGHHQTNVVEVHGIDQFKRLNGTIQVTPADVRKAQAYEKAIARFKQKDTLKLVNCEPLTARLRIDGHLGDWKSGPVASIGENAKLHMAYDKKNLYVAFSIERHGPLNNTGKQWDKLFKTGAAVDLMIGSDAMADSSRRAPVKGDKRLLMTVMEGKPVAVLYDAVVPGTPQDDAWQVVSPVTSISFDVVRRLTNADVVHQPTDRGYVVEAAIPLTEIGLTIKPDKRIKFDWGYLETDKNGTVVLSRTYWSNKATSTLADAPSEARLQPDLWGYCRFRGKSSRLETTIDPGRMLEEDTDIDLDDLDLD